MSSSSLRRFRFRVRVPDEVSIAQAVAADAEVGSRSSTEGSTDPGEHDADLESMTGKGIKRQCSELLELKKASDENFQRNVQFWKQSRELQQRKMTAQRRSPFNFIMFLIWIMRTDNKTSQKSKYPVLKLELRLISDLAVVIVSATCGGIALACAGQPVITGYLLVGSIIGPGGLNFVSEMVQVRVGNHRRRLQNRIKQVRVEAKISTKL